MALAYGPAASGQAVKAFPQAEGYGENSRGGRGGDVYHVTKLTDDGSVGTLRYGLDNAPSAGRTIVFDVGGWITLTSKLGVTRDNITIAGQTAPGGGIGVKGNQTSIGADNIVIRHMRFRPGKAVGRVDSLSISSGQNVIFDHVSAAFSYDENASANALVRGGVANLTMQYSTVSYGLEDHSAGSLIQNTASMSYHHNLYAHNNTRNPKARVEGDGIDWVNNVVYDYNNGFIAGDSATTDFFWKANLDGNYFITGPGDTGRPMVTSGAAQNYGLYFGTNAYDNDGDASHDGVLYTGNGVDATGLAGVVSGTYTWSPTRYGTKTVWQDATPQAAYQRVLAQFGATPWNRDEVDTLVHNNVVNRAGSLITRESDLVGISNGGFGTLAAGAAALDSDGDGIPNAWEIRHGTNPSAANHNGDFDQDGFTDLEEYLNDLAAFKAVGPLEFTGIGRFADSARWTRRWEPSRLDDVRVSTGAAFIDAVGQKAGTLSVGSSGGGNGRLYVTSGWLEVTNGLVVAGSGKVEQHGGEVLAQGGVTINAGGYRLLGGELQTTALTIASGATFDFQGGTLAMDSVAGDLTNQGGRLEVGRDAVTLLQSSGDLTLVGGELVIDLVSATSSDKLLVTGDVALGGVLTVNLLGGYNPAAGQSWPLLLGTTVTGAFAAVTPGFSVQQVDQTLWLVRDGAAAATPEPGGLAIALVAALASAFRPRRPRGLVMATCVTVAFVGGPASAASVVAIADAQLNENGTTGIGDAVSSGSGSGSSLNARWNFATATPNRNEWIALKFDLSAYADKSRLSAVRLRPTMFRSSTNNSTSLRLYALAPGVAGADWSEATVAYGTMPGFTFDANSTTNVLAVGTALVDLGTVAYSGFETEGAFGSIAPGSLTSLVQSMGSNNLLTLLVTHGASSNGQWRIASREATATETGANTGSAGSFAARLDFDVAFGGVLGDYNDDGVVNTADYTVWRDAAASPLPNEEVSPGTTDIADYLYWAERYGATDTGLPSAVTLAIPEPASAALSAVALIAVRRRHG